MTIWRPCQRAVGGTGEGIQKNHYINSSLLLMPGLGVVLGVVILWAWKCRFGEIGLVHLNTKAQNSRCIIPFAEKMVSIRGLPKS